MNITTHVTSEIACIHDVAVLMSDAKCLVARPTLQDADWRSVCHVNGPRVHNLHDCCKIVECGRTCVLSCDELPAPLVQRSVAIGAQDGALARFRLRLSCGDAPVPVTIAVAGGSVTAGPGGRSWANYMIDSLRVEMAASNHSDRISLSWGKLATSGTGPAYLSACWGHHIDDWGGREPEIAILEYAVNDFSESARDMEALLRELLQRGTLVVLLHHFSPAFMAGAAGYKGIFNVTGEAKHTRLARHYGLSSISVGEAVGLSRHSIVMRRARALANHGRPLQTMDERRKAIIYDERHAMMHPCSFTCRFTSDLIHPTPCGQRLMGQLATHAVRRLLLLDGPRSHSASRSCQSPTAALSTPESRPCVVLPTRLSQRRVQRNLISSVSRACRISAKCWSNVGPPAGWNLKPTRNEGFKLVNLKSSARDVSTKVAVQLGC